jgi:hypothetical protein
VLVAHTGAILGATAVALFVGVAAVAGAAMPIPVLSASRAIPAARASILRFMALLVGK